MPPRLILHATGIYLRTTTTGLSLLVRNMSPFHIIKAEKTIMARFKDCERSIRGDRHSFFNSESWPCTISSMLIHVLLPYGFGWKEERAAFRRGSEWRLDRGEASVRSPPDGQELEEKARQGTYCNLPRHQQALRVPRRTLQVPKPETARGPGRESGGHRAREQSRGRKASQGKWAGGGRTPGDVWRSAGHGSYIADQGSV